MVAASTAALAFLDLHPHAPGHTVVIPRTHAATLAELPLEDVGPLFELVQQVAKTLQEKLQCPGMTIGINQGEIAGQGIGHLHVHVLPRFANDGGTNIHAIIHNPPTPAQQDILNSFIS